MRKRKHISKYSQNILIYFVFQIIITIFVVQSDASSLTEKEEAPHGEGLYPGRDSPPNKSLNEMITSKTISFAFFWGLIRFRIRKTYKK